MRTTVEGYQNVSLSGTTKSDHLYQTTHSSLQGKGKVYRTFNPSGNEQTVVFRGFTSSTCMHDMLSVRYGILNWCQIQRCVSVTFVASSFDDDDECRNLSSWPLTKPHRTFCKFPTEECVEMSGTYAVFVSFSFLALLFEQSPCNEWTNIMFTPTSISLEFSFF